MVQMPAGIPVGTLAIGNAGATNAALFAAAILATFGSGPGASKIGKTIAPLRQARKVLDATLE